MMRNHAMESWTERVCRSVLHTGVAVLLVCLTLSSGLPAPTLRGETGVLAPPSDSEQQRAQGLKAAAAVAPGTEPSWDAGRGAMMAGSPQSSADLGFTNSSGGGGGKAAAVPSTVQTAEEDSRISTRRRRTSSVKSRQYSDVMKQLYSRTGYWLAIYDNETINGTHNKDDAHTHLRVTSESWGKIKIRGVLSGMYVCMNGHGHLYPWPEPREECKFQERLQSSFYAVFLSTVHKTLVQSSRGGIRRKPWYIGLNTNGKPRLGSKTKHKQIMAQFLLKSVNWGDSR